jgi:uncharacterized protein (DUF2147 family)
MMNNLLILMICSTMAADLSPSSELMGLWLHPDGVAHVRIGAETEQIEGKLVWSKEEKAQDYLGTAIFRQFTKTQTGWSGEVYSLKRKASYPATFRLTEAGKKLEVNVKAGFFTQEQIWTRIPE